MKVLTVQEKLNLLGLRIECLVGGDYAVCDERRNRHVVGTLVECCEWLLSQ